MNTTGNRGGGAQSGGRPSNNRLLAFPLDFDSTTETSSHFEETNDDEDESTLDLDP